MQNPMNLLKRILWAILGLPVVLFCFLLLGLIFGSPAVATMLVHSSQDYPEPLWQRSLVSICLFAFYFWGLISAIRWMGPKMEAMESKWSKFDFGFIMDSLALVIGAGALLGVGFVWEAAIEKSISKMLLGVLIIAACLVVVRRILIERRRFSQPKTAELKEESSMNEIQAEKKCIACREPIAVGAKRCPRCLAWQVKGTLYLQHPWPLSIIISLPLLLFLVLMYSINLMLGEPKSLFPKHKDKLTVAESSMTYGELNKVPSIVTIGVIHNGSDVSWKSVKLEVRYFNESRKLIDLDHETILTVIPARGDLGFKIESHTNKSMEEYASYQVSILWAQQYP